MHVEYGHLNAHSLVKLVSVEFDWERRVPDSERVIHEGLASERGEANL